MNKPHQAGFLKALTPYANESAVKAAPALAN